MLLRSIALMLKYFVEEKEFFLYPHRKVNDIFDIVLYKQMWFYQFFIDFTQGDSFLGADHAYQKSVIYNKYHEIKLINRFRKLFFYKVFVLEEGYNDETLKSLDRLYSWIETEKINIRLIILDLHSRNIIPIYGNFQDNEGIEGFLNEKIDVMEDDPTSEVNLLEIERMTMKSKGYYLGNKKAYITTLLMAANILYFIYMSMKGSTTNIYDLIEFGAKYNPLVAAGEYYRLISSMFIHIGIVHLLFNTYALKSLGKDVELIYGPIKFIIIYLISGIFGSLGSFLFSNAVSAGASGAIFGLMGAYLYFGIKRPAIFATRYGMNLITLIIINIFFGFTNGNIDNFAHLGGLIGGYLASYSLGLKDEKVFEKKRLTLQLITILIMVSCFFSGIHIQQKTWEYNLHNGIKFLRQDDLMGAQIQFEEGLSKNSNSPDLYYYLAYAHGKQGNRDRAIEYLQKTLSIDPYDTAAQKLLNALEKK